MGLHEYAFIKAAQLISHADSLLVAAGAGMGIDSGLPDFRGAQGFWSAYPALQSSGIRFQDIASPQQFRRDPAMAWGFYGHRLNLYRNTRPHEGFDVLQQIAAQLPNKAFVFTSNVDGHFQKAGFPSGRVLECHGSIHFLQCIEPCSRAEWTADEFMPDVDAERCLLMNEPPRCPRCGALARPNILMFDDYEWVDARAVQQQARLSAWMRLVERLVVIELGAGSALPAVRHFSERQRGSFIRINPFEPQVAASLAKVGLAHGALNALSTLKMVLEDTEFFSSQAR